MGQLRKYLTQYLPILLLGIPLLLLALFLPRFEKTNPGIFHIQLSGETGSHSIYPWKDQGGDCYLFLPSGLALSDVSIQLDTSAAVSLDGQPLKNGQTLEHLELNRTYTLKAGAVSCPLRVLQSANVSALHIHTESGTMKAVHADKQNTENITLSLFHADGTLAQTSDACTIRGRGNSTWVYEKRPYLLSFTEATDLLDMGAAHKWVLLANATDRSNLRNKLAYDLAGQLGFPWTPRCEYVDLYLNGEYRGLYLLTERVEVGPSRLDIGSDPDSFLCKLDLTERLATLENPFVTNLGRAVEISDRKDLSSAQADAIADKVQQMENAILSGQIEDILDLDSWVRRLMLDEVLENLDGDRASSYFYYTGGKFYAGPIWDYDHILGTRDTNLNPEALLAETRYKAPDKYTPYSNALYENPLFYSRLTALYEAEMLPLLRQLAQGGVEDLAQQIQDATTMNTLRWQHMFDYWQRPDNGAEYLTDYLTRRIQFLERVWLEGEEHFSVQVDIGADLNYRNFVVKPGECFTQLSQVEVPGMSDPVWVDSVTGEIYTPDQPITRDTQLNLLSDAADSQEGLTKELLLVLAYSGAIVLILSGLILVECRWRRPKRRANV